MKKYIRFALILIANILFITILNMAFLKEDFAKSIVVGLIACGFGFGTVALLAFVIWAFTD